MFKTDGSLIHSLAIDSSTKLPKQFTYPFYYQPHPLTIKASEEIQAYLKHQTDFEHNFGLDTTKSGLKIGKMFGVMIVQKSDNSIGYLAAFSGKLADSNHLKGFVPPIFDTLNKDGFYKKGEVYLNQLNTKIDDLEKSEKFIQAKEQLKVLKQNFESELLKFKADLKVKKKERDARRKAEENTLDTVKYEALLKELRQQSIKAHFSLRDFKTEWEEKIASANAELKRIKNPIDELKERRKQQSARLQKQLHDQYHFLNYNGQSKNLISVFNDLNLNVPPAGSGECAAPKLFQYAYEHHLKPIAMAEFWWGVAPKSQVRQHKQFYPSCRGKCEPILTHMMKGLNVEDNPMEKMTEFKGTLEILYEDDFLLVVNKPHEFLSVPGKRIKDSVLTRMQAYLPNAKGPLLVHRLDMSTSGLLLVAKNEKTHKNLQKLFIERRIKKRYVAILDGIIDPEKEIIELPLQVDYNNRPRQLVSFKQGKPAKTKVEIIDQSKGKTRVYFYPVTGRTHQLRVHSAHHLGLNSPILGDDLYGKASDRLYLHAEYLKFQHPVLNKIMEIKSDVPF